MHYKDATLREPNKYLSGLEGGICKYTSAAKYCVMCTCSEMSTINSESYLGTTDCEHPKFLIPNARE